MITKELIKIKNFTEDWNRKQRNKGKISAQEILDSIKLKGGLKNARS